MPEAEVNPGNLTDTLLRHLYAVLSDLESDSEVEYAKLIEDKSLKEIISYLNETEKIQWQKNLAKRDQLKLDMYNPSFWVKPINSYNNAQVLLLEQRIIRVQRDFMAVKVLCV